MTRHLFIPIIDNGMNLSRTGWAFSMLYSALTVLRDYKVDIERISYPYPDGAWNLAAQSFLESGADEVIKIDTDVIFEPVHLQMLLSHDEPLVMGLYPKKKVGMEFPVVGLDDGLYPFADDGRPDLREVKRCAGGFTRIHRSVFEGLKPHVECIECDQLGDKSLQWLFFKNLPGGHSEDFAFCDLYRAHGGRIMVDRRITCGHEGTAVYPIKGTY